VLCISLRTPFKEEYYQLRSTHTHIRNKKTGREEYCAIRLQNTRSRKDTNMFKRNSLKTNFILKEDYKQKREREREKGKQYIKREKRE
jgi:hypothetical protein